MKKLIASILVVAGASTSLYSQCNPFYVIKENGEWHMETFNAKGNLTWKTKQKVLEYNATRNYNDARISLQMEDAIGKEFTWGVFVFRTLDATIIILM